MLEHLPHVPMPLGRIGREVVELNAFAKELLELLIERLHEDRRSFLTLLSSRIRLNFHDKEKIGRDDWIRTSDPLTPSQVRYQAAPHPDVQGLSEPTDYCTGSPAEAGLPTVTRSRASRAWGLPPACRLDA